MGYFYENQFDIMNNNNAIPIYVDQFNILQKFFPRNVPIPTDP